VILELLVLLAAARLAAEVAERLSLPAVATEIAVGILLGPSLLGVVGHDDPLVFLGELGVIVLLLQVGLELDLDELTSVGRPALTVAVIGIVLPFAGGRSSAGPAASTSPWRSSSGPRSPPPASASPPGCSATFGAWGRSRPRRCLERRWPTTCSACSS
jgi:Kef-type K+ transport system membrane component KefB